MRTLISTLLMLSACVTAFAEPRGDTKILLPIVTNGPVYGAYGSIWTTRLSVLNTGSRDVVLDGYDFQTCSYPVCDQYRPTPPGITFHPELYWFSSETDGYFLSTEATDLPLLRVEVHVQDLSRQALTWGTEIPIVSEHDALTESLDLQGIPLDSRFRSRLRIYDFQTSPGRASSVRYEVFAVRSGLETPFDPSGGPPASQDEPLVSGTLPFRWPSSGNVFRPGFAFLDLDRLPLPPNVERIRVRVTPITPDLRFWAFVSVTNNETQHVTTISP